MTVWTSFLWKINIQLAGNCPEMVVKWGFVIVIRFDSEYIFGTCWWNFTTLITLISQFLVNLHPVEGWIDLSRATFILPASQEWRVIVQKIHRSSINKTSSLPLQVASVWFNLLAARQCTLRLLWKTVLQCYIEIFAPQTNFDKYNLVKLTKITPNDFK